MMAAVEQHCVYLNIYLQVKWLSWQDLLMHILPPFSSPFPQERSGSAVREMTSQQDHMTTWDTLVVAQARLMTHGVTFMQGLDLQIQRHDPV